MAFHYVVAYCAEMDTDGGSSGGPQDPRFLLTTRERLSFTVPEAARVLGVSESLIWQDIRSGNIATIRIGRRVLITNTSMQALSGTPAYSDSLTLAELAGVLGVTEGTLARVIGKGPFQRSWMRTMFLAGVENKSGAVWDAVAKIESADIIRKGITARGRQRIIERDGRACRYCGKTIGPRTPLHIDHVIPVRWGGTDDEENLVVACAPCNMRKSDGVAEIAACGHLRFDEGDRMCRLCKLERRKVS